jgi:hypothetical protein
LTEVDLQNVVVVAVVVVAVVVEGEEQVYHFERFDNLTRKVFDCSSLAVAVEDREEGSVPSSP